MNNNSTSSALPQATDSKRYLALFDFDGTISHKDSMLAFFLYALPVPIFIAKSVICAPVLLAYKLKLIDNERAKHTLLNVLFGSWDRARFTRVADDFSATELGKIIRPLALERIQQHIAAGHEVSVVSASLNSWLASWCKAQGVGLIATQPNFSNKQKFNGIEGRNCCYAEKVARIRAEYSLEDYSAIYAYGDSKGDHAMLELAEHRFYKPFRA